MYNNTCKTVGVLSTDFSHPQTAALLQEVNRQLNARGCAALLVDAAADDRARQLAPLLSAAIHLSGRFSAAFCAAAGQIPLIALDELNLDGFAAGAEMGQLLLAQGHQRFGYLQQATCADPARIDGFSSALAAAGKTVDQHLTAAGSGDDRDSGYQAMMHYLKRARAAGVFRRCSAITICWRLAHCRRCAISVRARTSPLPDSATATRRAHRRGI